MRWLNWFFSIVVMVFLNAIAARAITYSTNFMWINRNVASENTYVFPELRKKSSWDVEIVWWLSEWLKANPQGQFVFWYDKDFVDETQIKNTEMLFQELTKTHLTGSGSITLKNVNESPRARHPDYQKHLSNQTPFYMRVDLLRVALGLDYLETCTGECAYVYADVDKGLDLKSDGGFEVKDLREKALFDSETMTNLQNMALVMRPGPENSFLIMSNHDQNMMKALDEAVLKASFKRIDRMLSEEKNLRDQFPTDELKIAPFDKKFGSTAGFAQLLEKQKEEARTLAKRYVNEVYEMMTLGPLMAAYKFYKNEIELLGNLRIYEKGGIGELMSRVTLDNNSPDHMNDDISYRFLRYYNSKNKNFAKAEFMGRNTIRNDKIPTKNIGGSRSQSYTMGW